MAWIEVHQALRGHRKIKRLKRALKIKEPQAIGHMTMLWLWCIDNAPDGCLDELEPEDIAEAVDWTGDAQKFLDGLIYAGFVDQGDSLLVHDWQEYTGASLEKRNEKVTREKEQNRQRQQRYRDRNKTVTEPLRNASVTHNDTVTEPLRNAPNLTLPNLTLPNLVEVDKNCKDIGVTRNASRSPKSQAVSAYCKLISATPSTAAVGELIEFEKELGTEVCLKAIDEALDANAMSWKYIRAVLTRCKEMGVKSLEDWDRQEAQRQTKKTKSKGPAMCETVDSGLGYEVPTDPGDLDKLIEEGWA